MSSGTPSPANEETESLIQRYLDEDLDEEGFAQLQAILKEDPSARRRYRAATETVVLLREAAVKSATDGAQSSKAQRRNLRSMVWMPALVSCLVLVLGMLVYRGISVPPVAAKLVGSTEANWLSPVIEAGGVLPVGSQLQLASGSIELAFKSGAFTRLHGPALFEIESRNRGFLHYGKAFSVADNEASQGFTIRTASGTYVDQGTEFITQAGTDGYSQMHVVEGAVDADATGFDRRRVLSGNGIGFEVGDKPIMIQIEQGTETRKFKFPTIPPPSSEDYASTRSLNIEVDARGQSPQKTILAATSGPVDALRNGRAQRNNDDPSESFFFRNDSIGYIVFDLGQVQPVSSVHTYSWHRNRAEPEDTRRAVQRFTLWGAHEKRPERLPRPGNDKGWTRIARVDTDVFFQVDQQAPRPSQQACRLLPAAGILGEYRYLLFEVFPTSEDDDKQSQHTFFSEIDIFTE